MWLPKTKSEHAVFWSDLMLELHTISLQPCKHTAWICEGNVVKMFRKTKTFLVFCVDTDERMEACELRLCQLELLPQWDWIYWWGWTGGKLITDFSRSNNRQPRLATQDCQPDSVLWLNDVHLDQFNWENLPDFFGTYDLFLKILWQDLDLDSQ